MGWNSTELTARCQVTPMGLKVRVLSGY